MNKKITVAHICTSAQIGGTEKIVSLLLKQMDSSEFSHCLIVLKEKGPLNKVAEANGIPHLALEITSFLKLFRVVTLIKFFKIHKPDIFISYLFHSNLLARFLGKLFGKKVICGQRNIDSWRKWYHILIDRWTSHWCDLIISNSVAGKNRLVNIEKIPAEKIQVIYNGVEIPSLITEEEKRSIRKRYNLPDNKFIFLCAASFQKKKGHLFLLTAFKEVAQKYPDVLLVLSGDGDEKIKLTEFVKENHLEQNVVFTGVVTPLTPLMQACDAFVLASLWEGVPNVLLEAMACQKPIIASNVGGVSEIVEEGENGFLSNSADPDTMRDNFLKLLLNRPIHKAMGENVMNTVRFKFTVDQMIDDFQKTIMKVIESEKV